MVNNEIDPKILVVSDIHLGAFKSELDMFQKFLTDIDTGEFGNDLQALIILGDFFDLCTDKPSTLFNNKQIKNILEILNKIKLEKNLMFVLGNHEIPVTGNYDKKFKHRKTKFLERFKIGIIDDFFKDEMFCQYIILKKFDNEDSILLYDSIENIFDGFIKKIKINGLELDNNYDCLMTHGYQFDNELFRFLAGILWSYLIKSDDMSVKDSFDYLWNIIIKGDQKVKDSEFKVMLDQLPALKDLEAKISHDNFSEHNKHKFDFIKLYMRILEKWEESSKYEYYIDGIRDFLKDKNHNLTDINNIIYGHSHKWKSSQENIGNNEINIINDGAWQHVTPSYVQIFSKGRMKINEIPANIL